MNARDVTLQWGRVIVHAEMAFFHIFRLIIEPASMGPRDCARGNPMSQIIEHGLDVASMGPRDCARGNAPHPEMLNLAGRGFNGAA